MSRVLEICCDSLHAALAARDGGAHRIELCACLECDGLTPSAGLLERVLARVSLPVFAMVRPRPGDFVYSETELEVMLADIAEAKECGAAGIVGGALAAGSARIDREATAALVEAARPLPFTFHRAFDLVAEPEPGLGELAGLGVARVLTTGGGNRAVEALAGLRRYQEAVVGRMIVVGCGGIRAGNLAEVAEVETLMEFHSAARSPRFPATVDPAEVSGMARLLEVPRGLASP
jgi:copper homeostasis protein